MPGYYRLDAAADPSERMPSNSIIDIEPHNGTIWLGTGRGLTQHYLHLGDWAVIPSSDEPLLPDPEFGYTLIESIGKNIGHGGVSAFAITDTVIWASTAYTETSGGSFYPAGGGVGFSRDGGENWHWMPQPVDSIPEDPDEAIRQNYHPTTTNIQNVTYDIALSDSAVWITSWGGGLRRLKFEDVRENSVRWEVMTPDGQPFWALQNLRHRAFCAVYTNGALWIGTAAGISRTIDEGVSWENHSFQTESQSISGNFVTAIDAQESPYVEGHYNIWAATWKATLVYEYYGVSVTEDNGTSWRVALSDSTYLPSGEYLINRYGPLRVHNFGFIDSTVYAAADGGLWKSNDNGYTWGDGPMESIYDPTIDERLEDIDFFSVTPIGDSLWVGTNAGLAVGWFDEESEEFTWRIHRAHQKAGSSDQPQTYAYPSPFSPKRGQITRFQISVDGPTDVKYKILNFAMENVYESGHITLPGGGVKDMSGYGALQWDGRDSDGSMVANGVYFYKINAGGYTWWGKVMVLN